MQLRSYSVLELFGPANKYLKLENKLAVAVSLGGQGGDILAEGVLTPLGAATTLGIYIAGLLVGWVALRRQDV